MLPTDSTHIGFTRSWDEKLEFAIPSCAVKKIRESFPSES